MIKIFRFLAVCTISVAFATLSIASAQVYTSIDFPGATASSLNGGPKPEGTNSVAQASSVSDRDTQQPVWGTSETPSAAAARSQKQEAVNPPTYTVLYTFTGGADGYFPHADLIRDEAGDLYSTTEAGGIVGQGLGVVFKLDRADKETVLHSFTGADGSNPFAGLIRDDQGNLYGTTRYGGTYGVGTVFNLDPTGKEAVLYSFTGGTDGANPYAGLIRDKEGNLYGTTLDGGDLSCTLEGPFGCGVVFRIDRSGQETVLHSFTGGGDGGFPAAGLIQDEEGNLYGTTQFGGLASCSFYCGVVFKLDLAGKETVLHSFTGYADGSNPFAGLIRDEAGNLYGTASAGGPGTENNGVVFKLDRMGKETVLHTFTGGADGAFPFAGLIRDREGNLYGTTAGGGDLASPNPACGGNGCGVVFKVNASGKETVMYTFAGAADGAFPTASLIWDQKGSLYGTAEYGGDLGSPQISCSDGVGCGVVFELKSCRDGDENSADERLDGGDPR